jgi:hypothetical protein
MPRTRPSFFQKRKAVKFVIDLLADHMDLIAAVVDGIDSDERDIIEEALNELESKLSAHSEKKAALRSEGRDA